MDYGINLATAAESWKVVRHLWPIVGMDLMLLAGAAIAALTARTLPMLAHVILTVPANEPTGKLPAVATHLPRLVLPTLTGRSCRPVYQLVIVAKKSDGLRAVYEPKNLVTSGKWGRPMNVGLGGCELGTGVGMSEICIHMSVI